MVIKAKKSQRYSEERIGPVMQKVLLLLSAGLALSLTQNPKTYFRIMRSAAREWQRINQRALHKAIRKLYASQLIEAKEYKDGTVALLLSNQGQQRILRYKLDQMEIKKPAHWDGWWRVYIFDIPEDYKKARDALAKKFKTLGFYRLQKSVFLIPYECKDEIDFLVEFFGVRTYVRFLRVKETDVDLDLKHHFGLR